ncbi:hypothetical protein THAOC_24482, partial [Thalassiosira oceanica]
QDYTANVDAQLNENNVAIQFLAGLDPKPSSSVAARSAVAAARSAVAAARSKRARFHAGDGGGEYWIHSPP